MDAVTAPLLDWIIRYQPVVFGGRTYHEPAGPMWGDYLRHRFGGCMADTTCLLGLVPTIAALVDARDAGLDLPVEAQLAAMRQLLEDRRLFYGRSGAVIPLSSRTSTDPDGAGWLAPAFPLNHIIDLIELVDLARRLEMPADAMTDAVELIESWQLTDGGWPMLGTRRIADAYRPEGVNRNRSSAIIAHRVHALSLGI